MATLLRFITYLTIGVFTLWFLTNEFFRQTVILRATMRLGRFPTYLDADRIPKEWLINRNFDEHFTFKWDVYKLALTPTILILLLLCRFFAPLQTKWVKYIFFAIVIKEVLMHLGLFSGYGFYRW
jgi:hypothetical protein